MTGASKGTKRKAAYHRSNPQPGRSPRSAPASPQPARRLRLVLGLKGGLAILRSFQRSLVAFLLVGQLLDQAVTLLSQGVELGFLSAKAGLGPTQLLPQFGVGRCRYGIEDKSNKKEVVKKDPTRLLSSRPESRGLHPVGALTRPHRRNQETRAIKNKRLTRMAARVDKNSCVYCCSEVA